MALNKDLSAAPIRANGHLWRYDGGGGGLYGQYYYTCEYCGANDWIPSYGKVEELYPKTCTGSKTVISSHAVAAGISAKHLVDKADELKESLVTITASDFDSLLAKAAGYERSQDISRQTYDHMINVKDYNSYLLEVKRRYKVQKTT